MKVWTAIAAFLLATSAHAQVDPTQQAGRLASNCKAFLRGTGTSMTEIDCPARVGAFLSGWNAGVQRGVRMAFILDQANLQTTKGVDDIQRRNAAILPAVQCMGVSGKTFQQFIAGYIDYVAEKPSREFEDYGKVLGDYAEDRVCKP